MARATSAIAVAALISVAGVGGARAMPIAPLPTEASTSATDIIPVYYYGGRHYPYRWRGAYYPYRWRGAYYRHRYYRYNRWHYY